MMADASRRQFASECGKAPADFDFHAAPTGARDMDGLLLRANRLIPTGTPVSVRLQLIAGTRPVVGRGSVMRTVEDKEVAIRLSHTPLTENCRLQEFLLPITTGARPA